ncbi:MAG: hypothetical protein AB1805_04310 [Nitrospirota bacterium]
MNISKLSFGAPAAERDIEKGLIEYFVESDAYRRIFNREKFILLGNRGSGKSAIFKILAEKEKNAGTLVIELSPEDYSYEMFSGIMAKEHQGFWAKQGAYAAAWKYLIYISVMRRVSGRGGLKSGAAAKVYNFLRDNFKGHQDNPLDILLSYLKRFEGVKVGPYEVGAKTRELQKLYKLEEIQSLIPDIITLCKRQNVVLLVDELDRGWDASEDAKAFVAGLFQAAIKINEHAPSLRVLVSLRKELYDNIPALYEDAQKYRDIIEEIQWDEPMLMQMVTNRIRYSLPELKEKSIEECWNSVYAETLDYRQTKSFNYMVDRTLYRPREIIQFCTETSLKAREVNSWPIDYDIISKTEVKYSEDRAKDIAAEYRFQYPGLLKVFEIFRGLSYNLDRDGLELLCLGITMEEYNVDEASSWCHNQSPEFLIEVLWRIGFLRAQAVGGVKGLRRSGSSYLGPHQISNLNLHTISRFHVHPMFRSFLAMKESRT